MTRLPGRGGHRRKLADMAARLPSTQFVPDRDGAITETSPIELSNDPLNRLIVRTESCKGRMTDFAIIHETRAARSAPWQPVASIDCRHNEVHQHLYRPRRGRRREKKERTVLWPITDYDAIADGYVQAYKRLTEAKDENLRRWKGGR